MDDSGLAPRADINLKTVGPKEKTNKKTLIIKNNFFMVFFFIVFSSMADSAAEGSYAGFIEFLI